MQPLTELQEKWVTALESGKYNQTNNRLRFNDEYCCLGVACDLFDNERWDEEERYIRTNTDGATEMMMTQDVVNAFRFRSNSGMLTMPQVVYDDDGVSLGNAQSLVDLNDTFEWSFDEIAEFVRTNPHKVFMAMSDGR